MPSTQAAIMELLSHIGIYPHPTNLTLTNTVKGYVLIWVFCNFIIINGFINLNIRVWKYILSFLHWFRFLLPVLDNIKLIIAQLFWQSLIYLINKRKIKIIISGIDLNNDQEKLRLLNLTNSLVISNHRSLFDFILIYYLKTLVSKISSTSSTSSSTSTLTTLDPVDLNFINWNSIWRVPSLHTIWNFFKNDENWILDQPIIGSRLDHLVSKDKTENKNNWLVHFPEVNIINDHALLLQNQQVEQYLIPKLNETLYPRFQNFNNIVESINEVNKNVKSPDQGINNLIDLSIVYYNPIQNNFKNPNLFEILTLKQPFFIININIKLKSISKLPQKKRKLEKWLENNWSEKDKTIELMQKQLKINE